MIQQKSLAFAIRVVRLCRRMIEEQREYVLSKQLIRSGTAIGALVKEAEHGQSKRDFLHKMSIALKEANETVYWLVLLRETGYLTEPEYSSMNSDAEQLLKILISIVKTTKTNLNSGIN